MSSEDVKFGMFLVGACGGFVVFIWRMFEYFSDRVVYPVKEIQKSLTEHKEETTFQITKIHEQISEVRKEVKPNGGSSLKDIVVKTYAEVRVLRDRDTFNFYLDSQPKFECDTNGLCIRVNEAWSALTDISEHKALGNGWLGAISDMDVNRVMKEWEMFIEKDYPFNVRCKIRNGEDVILKAISKRAGSNIEIIIGSFEKV